MNGTITPPGAMTPRTGAGYTDSTRPLVLQHPTTQTRITILVNSLPQNWTAAEVARESFLDHLIANADDLVGFEEAEVDPDHPEQAQADQRQKQLVLASHFLSHLAHLVPSLPTPTATVLLSAFVHFHGAHLAHGAKDVHSLAAELDAPIRALVITSYYAARTALEQVGRKDDLPVEAKSSLLEAAQRGDKEVYALFGGQGMNEVYWEELSTLFALYRPLLLPFLTLASTRLSELAQANAASQFFTHGLAPLAWLLNPSALPPVAYLASCPISLPLIGLTQLCQYLVLGLCSSLSPKATTGLFAGATGHSQGVVSACVVARKFDSWTDFYAHAVDGLEVLFQIGLQGAAACPPLAVAPALEASAIENGEGPPTPMLAVTGLELPILEKRIAEVNKFAGGSVGVSLFNGPRAFVVTGRPADLVGLSDGLRKNRAPAGKDQSKIPHSKRLPVFSMRFLPISVPYHSTLLASASSKAIAALSPSIKFNSTDLSFPVFNTETGAPLEGDLVPQLFSQIFTCPIHWIQATSFPASATHAIDFGTGGSSGIGSLCVRNWEGRGIRTIMLGNRASSEAWSSGPIKGEGKWEDQFRPKLVNAAGKIVLDTRMSRLLGKPPLMVAGMTPCTVKAGFVSAVLKAGFHVELAGGGLYNAKRVRERVAEIQKLVNKPGVGVTLNSLYINQRQWTFQLPLWCEMKKEGLPIEGLCVAAGIPSTEKATEIIAALTEAGIKHVSFKPGSVDGIRQVVNIARAAPHFPILLQWTGGRAGGHHSCEDFHAPLLSTYASIRSAPNIILVGGSGFGADDGSDTYPYLTGEWSLAYGVQRMPLDGFLFASRVMVAKEAHTSESVKQLIVEASGCEDSKWEQTYDKPTGGIMTVTSELGEPIHKVATRGVKLWAEFDKQLFSLPREKQVAWLNSKKQYVIDRLNADFQKPWFGAKSDGKTCDLDDMTYAEVNARLVRLMYVSHEKRWVDPTLRNLTGDWIRRVEERLSNVNEGSVKVSALQSYSELQDPHAFLDKFMSLYPAAETTVLSSADVAYFLAITQRPGQKPVPFIPVLDQSFSVWFKKDSLWQSEDVEAVFDQDPQRTCILQGPVAVRHCKTTQQPIGDLLGGIAQSLADRVLADYYGGDAASVPSTAYLAPEPAPLDADLLASNHIAHTVEPTPAGGEKHVYRINGVLPPTGDWLAQLAGPKLSWLQAFLSNVSITHGEQTLANPVKRVLAPRHGQRVELSVDKDGQPEKLDVFGGL